MEAKWSVLSAKDVIVQMESSETGLTREEASSRLESYGQNVLPAEKTPSLVVRFIGEFKSPLIYILLAAAFGLLVLGETDNALIIMAVLLFNAIVGLVQEGRAQNTLRALKSFAETNATVIRDGSEYIISDREVIPGDIILLQEGERVPADARLIETHNLRVDESSLTGESLPVEKITEQLVGEMPASEQKNCAFKGTFVVAGNARAVVVSTGRSTLIGSIAEQIKSGDTEIPLKEDVRKLSRRIIAVVATIVAVLFTVGLIAGHPAREMFATVVSLAVSIIPEGLPIVMTLVLASGVWRMSKRGVLVKKLQAVEALGQAKIIAVDKTGTLTKNELIIRRVWVKDAVFSISGSGYGPEGEVRQESGATEGSREALSFVAALGARLSSARLSYAEDTQTWRVSGDPTEASLITLGMKFGYKKDELVSTVPLVAELPFDYRLKYHATIHQLSEGKILEVAGAPETVLSLCTSIAYPESKPLSSESRKQLESIFMQWSADGLRVLALAARKTDTSTLIVQNIGDLAFIGFVGIEDALRPEAVSAIADAGKAGIRVVMITGDYPATACAIGKEAGLYRDGDRVLTGSEIDGMTDPELAQNSTGVTIFARVTPEHKARIVSAYRQRGEIIAMTGDGVNDAPSLVAADLGVAMGKIGTEVAKEAADLVLIDDNFGNIVAAVEEGRSIYRTIKKVILYLFSTSAGEVLTIAGALFIGLPLPLIAVQIIWLNFVTDGFLDVSLAMEPKEHHLLDRNVEQNQSLFDKHMFKRLLFMALPMAIGSLALFSWYLANDAAKAVTVSLTVLAVFQWFNAWNCRSDRISAFRLGLSNKFLLGATVTIFVFQLFAVYSPLLQGVLHTVPLALIDWVLIIAVASTILTSEEIRKYFVRHRAEMTGAGIELKQASI